MLLFGRKEQTKTNRTTYKISNLVSYKIAELAKIISAKTIGKTEGLIDEIYFDSRTIYNHRNAVFFDFSNNGISYIKDAYRKGIRIFVVAKIKENLEGAVYLKVSSPVRALQQWAEFHRNRFDLETIGITGSNGKTIVKEWLNQLLWKDFSIVRSPKSYNSQIGVPLSVLKISVENNLGIFEAGISQPNEMQLLEKIIRPEIGVLTHIGSAHLENFESVEQLIFEKLKLFENSKKIIFNADDNRLVNFIQKIYPEKELIGFGKSEGTRIQVLNVEKFDNNQKIDFRFNSKNYQVEIPFSDEAAVENICCVLTVISLLSLDFEKTLSACKYLLPIEMRLEIKEGIRNSLIINDSFNSDLHSVKVALDVLAQQTLPRKSLILTDVLQSNLDKDILYKEVADLVNSYPINDLILIGKYLPKYKYLFNSNARVYNTTDEFLKTLNLLNVNNEAILIKGARTFGLEKVSTFLEKQAHDTVLEVNLQALTDNLNFFKNRLKPTTKIMVMIKANAYGAGSFEVAHTLAHQNVDYLGAAYVDEGVELRKLGISMPIMIMNPEQSSYSPIIDYGLEPEMYSMRVLNLFTKILKEKSISEPYPIHLKIDTGMNRLGFRVDQLNEVIAFFKNENLLKIQSVFTHLATADIAEEKEFAFKQLKQFDEVYKEICNNLNIQPIKHALNSSGVIHFPDYQYDMVRLGIGTYGFSDELKIQKQLKNVLTLKTVISRISTIEVGETVSYGRRFKAERKTRIATLPVGYADGIRRSLSNGKTKVNIHGKLVPIVGTICMDMMMVDITDLDCSEGDEVILFGENPTVEDMAKSIDTISYEILTSISQRVKRIYYKE